MTKCYSFTHKPASTVKGAIMRTTKSLILSAVILSLAALPCFADVSEATHVLQGDEAYSPIDESQVKIFAFKPNVPFKVIGAIEAHGMAKSGLLDQLDILSQLGAALANESYGPGEKEDMALAVRALKREAASMGANGVIILKQAQVRVGPNATERRIIGAAIRY
ncbi:MAG TPA: hypothetical protein PLO14_07055 [Accumulibacter sp.]|nr:hypothetical protein [Accumulibacter sp.]MCM8661866.1 hypothetical protein [Accumulibacter sp.]HNC51984.1 hypothetical protein [Accumulibacter sp.]